MKRKKRLKPMLEHFKEKSHRWSLSIVFSVIVFFILLIAIALGALVIYLLIHFGVIGGVSEDINNALWIFLMSGISLVIGSVTVFFSSKIPLRPINNLINKMNRLASGDFQARLKFGSLLSNHPAFHEITVSFNKMAEELEQTELLRRDFINNFSHEFKTPIVSIAGLAKVLRKGNLTEEQRLQYLQAIEEESIRLSYMATNVLNLTKIENQTILTDVSAYNISEQIRSCVLLLENKWLQKNIEWDLEFDEYNVEANEELLKQVWINLIDNAIKFTPYGGNVCIQIEESDDHLTVSVCNTGSEIDETQQKKIFNKFYQGDESHSSEGNGIGLSIVKRVTELHKGTISLKSGDGKTEFIVRLPKKQVL